MIVEMINEIVYEYDERFEMWFIKTSGLEQYIKNSRNDEDGI